MGAVSFELQVISMMMRQLEDLTLIQDGAFASTQSAYSVPSQLLELKEFFRLPCEQRGLQITLSYDEK